VTGRALAELEATGRITIVSSQPTRGGSNVSTIQLAELRKRTMAIAGAATRKQASSRPGTRWRWCCCTGRGNRAADGTV
jgi:hypothetical protein